MKEFIEVSRAATCASVVILESCSPESVVAKRRDSVQKPYGMTFVWGGRTVNTSILSFPSVVVGNLSYFFFDNNGSPTKFLGDDGNNNNKTEVNSFIFSPFKAFIFERNSLLYAFLSGRHIRIQPTRIIKILTKKKNGTTPLK